jgi:hypothetical protein
MFVFGFEYCLRWLNARIHLANLGRQNQTLDKSDLGLLAEGKTMVIGLDVTHPSPGSRNTAPSVAALVSSIGPDLAQWPAQIRVQKARQEQVDGLDDLMEPALERWKAHNANSLPENILVCRDGVSEGQYAMVRDVELPALRRACAKVYPQDQTAAGFPHFTVLVVGKRHHTRFYPAAHPKDTQFRGTAKGDTTPGEGGAVIRHDKTGNSLPGTVVDRGVTEVHNWDFFLQAHAALQGTARPAHYFVIHDDIFRRYAVSGLQQAKGFQNTADILESLMHNMCYLYGRATKAVSICPPAYYADIACERARCYLSKDFDPSDSMSIMTAASDPTDWTRLREMTSVHANLRNSMFYI